MAITDIICSWSWCSISLALLVVLVIYYMIPLMFPSITDLPGPTPYPVLGNMLCYMKRGIGFMDIEHIKQYGKVFKILEGRNPAIVVADVDLLKQIMVKDFTEFSNRRIMPARGLLKQGLFDSRDSQWKRLRHLLTPSFTSGKLKKMISATHTCVDRLVKNLEEKATNGEKMELKEATGAFAIDVIASTGFGLDLDSQKDFNNPFVTYARKLTEIDLKDPIVILCVFFPFTIPIVEWLDLTLGPKDCYDFYRQFLDKMIKERQSDQVERSDFLQMMLDSENMELDTEGKEDLQGVQKEHKDMTNSLSKEEILAQCLLFFFAGYDTTSTTMAFMMYNLSQNPDVQEKLYQEIQQVMMGYKEASYEAISNMSYLDMCIQETLRIFPPIIRADRHACQDVNLDGLRIPKGTTIVVPIYAMHHDPEVWPQPEKFNPDRFSPDAKQARNAFHHLPFGMGPRNCIGMRFALMEVKLAFVKLVQKYRFKPAGIALDMDLSVFLKSKTGVWAIPELR